MSRPFQSFTHNARGQIKHAWDNFWDFMMRDNILEVAIGLIIASAFTKLVNSFVSDLLLPIISLLPFLHRNLDQKFAVLRKGPHYHRGYGYNTLKQARDDGALVMAYGAFLNNLVSFLAVGLALYSIGQIYTWISHDVVIKRTVKCRYCRKWISSKALRCVNCTSWQDGREDQLRA
ncbi:putative large-conductance mechanosensitive channel [Talaromyces proteolyticus]|uniref:Large-conductance mechanosensitive channel n=1 Tax=Talaromyces proteolyticus TaxID=1131652 RepID=A0AAD4Q5H6_9EURO|nr:putative large-conductance mechanosensitive channel [Talaromyces proteolyticus]KAH8704224.1 putative large-conductance mechanosensitive channel [Talaromyces proteolyticus]